MFKSWPDPLTPHKKEADLLELGKKCLDYGAWYWYEQRKKMIAHRRKLRDSYNGVIDRGIIDHVDKQYGKDLRVKYVDYAITRNKLDTICGEFLQRPLNCYVYISNKEAVFTRIQQRNFLTGMMVARKEVDRLRLMGFDVAKGMKAPESNEEINKALDLNGIKEEVMMNKAVSDQISRHRLKKHFYKGLKETALVSEVHGRTYIDDFGKVLHQPVKMDNAIFIELEDDDFCERSPIHGQRMLLTKNEVYRMFDLTEKEKDIIKNAFEEGENSEKGIIKEGAEFCLEVFHLEFFLLDPFHRKIVVDANTGERLVYDISEEYMETSKDFKRDIKKGVYEVETRYKETLYEGYKFGKLDIYKRIQKVKNQIIKNDDPFPAFSTYTHLLFNTENGIRVSFFEAMEQAKHLYNMVRFQINRELYKIKGTAVTYNRAFLPTTTSGKPISINDVLNRLINDGLYDYNTAKTGNYSGQEVDISKAIQVLDLGPGSSLGTLLNIAYNIETLLDKIGSVNDNRQGNTSASESVTNAQSNIQLSRTITEPMFYFYDRYMEQVIMRICEFSKISWYLNPEIALKILGAELVSSLEEIAGTRWMDFDASVIDSRKEEQMRQKMFTYLDRSVQAGELPPQAAMKAEMKDTLAEAQLEIAKGWEALQRLKMEEQKNAEESKQAQIKMALDREDFVREDEQAHELQLAGINQQQAIDTETLKTKNKAVLSQQSADQQRSLQNAKQGI